MPPYINLEPYKDEILHLLPYNTNDTIRILL